MYLKFRQQQEQLLGILTKENRRKFLKCSIFNDFFKLPMSN